MTTALTAVCMMAEAWMLLIPGDFLPAQKQGLDQEPQIAVDTASVIQYMVERNRDIASKFQGYKTIRTFHAENSRSKKSATMVVETTVAADGKSESKLVSFEGSEFIRKHVFQRILESETEARRERKEIEISPENYRFRFERREVWDRRECLVFAVTPLRISKWAINGHIWVDSKDLQIARIVGSPSKRPSFWTLRTRIEKSYRKQNDRWLPARLLAESSIFIVGKSTLEISYFYPGEAATNAAPDLARRSACQWTISPSVVSEARAGKAQSRVHNRFRERRIGQSRSIQRQMYDSIRSRLYEPVSSFSPALLRQSYLQPVLALSC